MTFLYPIGLLGLIGIPILILIYIIKSKYTEQVVASTYLWTLSERFLKRRNPLNRLTGIISLILQLLLVAAISVSVAHPIIVLEGEANEYCFILDASGSMSMTDSDGTTRFDSAKQEIASKIDSAVNGSTYSLVYVGDSTRVVYEKLTDKEKAKLLLSELTAVHSEISLTEAIGIAQGYFNENSSALTYLVTDKSYKSASNLSVLNVSGDTVNYSLLDVEYAVSGKTVTVTGKVISHESDATLNVSVSVDDYSDAAASAQVECKAGEYTPFTLRLENAGFYSLTVSLTDPDGLSYDSSVTLYNVSSENSYSTLIVSDNPYFIKAAIASVSPSAEIKTVTVKEYESASGYGLYIFDSFTPDTLPTDGTVWFFNPTESLEGSGFAVQGTYSPEEAVELELSTSTATLVRALTENMTGEDIYVTEYVKCSLYDNFTTLLSHKGNPVVFTGANEYGNREVVFAFDLHESNFALLVDYVALIDNLVEYSFPGVLDATDYVCGESLVVNVVSGCDSIVVTAPSGNATYLDVTDAVGEMTLAEAGTYKITVTVSGNDRDYYVFSEFPSEEGIPTVTEEEISLQGDAGNEGIDGIYDNLMILFIALVILFSLDWMVYCYEKYQLR